MNFIGSLVGGGLGLVWMLAGPVTYIILVVDTWSTKAGVAMKLLINLTLDALLAAIFFAEENY